MNTRNILNLILIGLCNILAGISLSILSPFYPTLALSRGVSVTESGLVFGSVFITTVIVTPLCGKYLHVGGGARMFLLVGSFICAVGNISFGFLDRVHSGSAFLALSFIIRIITAVGEGAMESSTFTLAAQQGTKENRGKLISFCEGCFGVGTMFGPSVGGLLYQVGGFSTPFWICGGLLLGTSVAAVFLLKQSSSDHQALNLHRIGWCELLQVPAVPICLFSLALAGSSWAWYSASLAPFLSAEYGLSPAQCGLMFLIFGVCYALFTPVFGFLMDRGLSGLATLALGNFLITVGFVFMGPIPQLEVLSGNLWLTGLSIGIQGLGCASTYVGTLVYMFKSATAAGLPDTEQTQGMVSSLWVVADCLGGYVGSSMGGFFFDKLGFRGATLVESGLTGVSVIVLVVVAAFRCGRTCGNQERDMDGEREGLIGRTWGDQAREGEREGLIVQSQTEEIIYGTVT